MKRAIVAKLVEEHRVPRAKAWRIVKVSGPYAIDVWLWVQKLLYEAHHARGRKIRARDIKVALWVALIHLSALNESVLFFLLDRRHILPRRLLIRGELKIFIRGAVEVLRPVPVRQLAAV